MESNLLQKNTTNNEINTKKRYKCFCITFLSEIVYFIWSFIMCMDDKYHYNENTKIK